MKNSQVVVKTLCGTKDSIIGVDVAYLCSNCIEEQNICKCNPGQRIFVYIDMNIKDVIYVLV